MDAHRFDTFAKTFASSTNRRRVIGLLLGGITTSIFPWITKSNAAECRLPGRTCDDSVPCCMGHCGEKDDKGNRRCVCPDGLAVCHSVCVDLEVDPANCGDCDNACTSSESPVTCQDGNCVELASPKCPTCGRCQQCDPAGCSECEDPCLAEALCKEASRNLDYARIHVALTTRGFEPNGDLAAVVIVDGGSPSGSNSAIGARFVNPIIAGEEALLFYVPGLGSDPASIAIVTQDGAPILGLAIGTTGRVEEVTASGDVARLAESAAGLRAMLPLAASDIECAKCHENCDSLNSASGNAVVCTLVGFGACSKAKNPYAVLACGAGAAYVCNKSSAACNEVVCEMMLDCPHVCDSVCEAPGPTEGTCVDKCTKPNSRCRAQKCFCKYVTCGEDCCGQGEYCKGGACVPDCGPCWFPNNDGQCFDVCKPVNAGQDAGECCAGPNTPRGVCCLSREHCCEGTCKDKVKNPPCGQGEAARCCPDDSFCAQGSEGIEVCCLDELMCGGICCGGDEDCIGGKCCPMSMQSPQGGCFL